jgi:transglutaminase-like putative cysteine protease
MQRNFKYTILICLFLVIGICSEGQKTNAQEQFETSYKTVFDIADNGETLVTQDVTIINKEDEVLATVYSISVRQMNIYDVKGSDTAGELDIDIKRDPESDKTTITVQLEEKVIGKDRSNEVRISYKTMDLANKVGEIWNVNLPKASNIEEIKEYETIIKVPKSFGPQIYISPKPAASQEEGQKTVYVYSKKEIIEKAITATFGKNQILNFELKYDLLNSSFIPRKQSVALPLDIRKHQQIYLASIEPKPTSLKKDIDGNVIATFWIKPNHSIQVVVRGSAKIFGNQISPDLGGKIHEIPDTLKKIYTKADLYWEVDDSKVKEIATELFDPHKTVSENAQTAYKFTTENLEYNYEVDPENSIKRNGALKALTQNGPWACMEFTDVFIALTRAMGIPARELNGFAFSAGESLVPISVDFNKGDLLHSWAEFYDPNFGWVQVDPTWGTTSGIDYFTKLDTNHLTFVVKGVDSEEPYPAGAYRLDTEQKQINVDFAEEQRNFVPQLEFKKAISWNLIKFLQGKRRYIITNKEGPIIYKIAGSNKILFPFSKESVYLDKTAKELIYEDFNGVENSISKNL